MNESEILKSAAIQIVKIVKKADARLDGSPKETFAFIGYHLAGMYGIRYADDIFRSGLRGVTTLKYAEKIERRRKENE